MTSDAAGLVTRPKYRALQKCLGLMLGATLCLSAPTTLCAQTSGLVLNEHGYFEATGLNVMVFHDAYPEGHQSGITIIQHGVRVAANGDLRLEPAPGQWQPVPKVGESLVNRENSVVSVACSYPNPDLNRKGFNPISYPDLTLHYSVNVKAEGLTVRITVDLQEALPAEWIGRVGFNLELFPGDLFGRSYYLDEETGIFPRQLDGPMIPDQAGDWQIKPLAEGKTLVVAPESEAQRLTITAVRGRLQLLDGRAHHNNGWFIVRSVVPAGATQSAVEWVIAPNVIPDWKYQPVIQLSQIGYHPGQAKVAVIECDPRDESRSPAVLQRILPSGERQTVLSAEPVHWGKFLRYQYRLFDFSQVTQPGSYRVTYDDRASPAFAIDAGVFDRHVWQPVLEYFLPVQMCHMRVNDRYRVWHDLCHMDDALMAPVDTLHFDGYAQGSSTLTPFQPSARVPGLNVGGWHDAGDFDLRVESQAQTVHLLALMREAFDVHYDETTIDQDRRIVELHRPDGKLDILQQIEHGALSLMAGYRNLGRLYRGIICSNLRQYVLLGDASAMTDNRFYNASLAEDQVTSNESGRRDDRWVFTEENPGRELLVAGCLAAATRVLQNYNRPLARECLQAAEALWQKNQEAPQLAAARIETLVELLLTTHQPVYRDRLAGMLPEIEQQIHRIGWALGRVQFLMNADFNHAVAQAVRSHDHTVTQAIRENPFNVPYRPRIWGAGWDIQRFGVEQYYLHQGWPDIVSREHVFHALNFVLGCHPGSNTASFASGVGAHSMTVAYGFNRADWSYIPGGVVSGTGLIQPDFPELKEWPFLWQQAEYVIGGGAENFMFLVLAARQMLAER